jgi:Protein of unknown function (DUF3887)
MSLNYVQSMGLTMVRFGVLPILATAIGLAFVSCSPPKTEPEKAPQEEASVEEPAPPQSAAPVETAAKTGTELDTRARRVVDQLVAGDFEAVAAGFDATMKRELSVAQLETAWNQVAAQTGAFKAVDKVTRSTQDDYEVVEVTCQLENAKANVKVVYDKAGKIAGLWIQPAE